LKLKLALLLAVLAGLVVAAPASSVQYGEPDVNNQYPYVGLMVAYDEDWNPLWRCSGSLIENDLFLTAAHCVEEPAANIAIWFDYDVTALKHPAYPDPDDADAIGVPYTHPGWTGALTIPNTSDVGVVEITKIQDRKSYPTTYGQLAPVGYLDTLATKRGQQDITFTVVGYGLQLVKPRESRERIRMIGTVHLVNLNSALTDGWNLHYSSNPGKGHGGSGGTCFGDSGGPVIHDGYIVGVNSFVLNLNCKGSAFAYRVDTDYAQDFIDSHR
jgi:secreted trypsin-like serine protease